MIPPSYLIEEGKEYLEKRQELLKLKAVEEGSIYMAKTISIFVYALLTLFGLLLLCIGLGRYLNTVLDSTYQGFYLASAAMLIVLFLAYLFRKIIFGRWVRNAVIGTVLSDEYLDPKTIDYE